MDNCRFYVVSSKVKTCHMYFFISILMIMHQNTIIFFLSCKRISEILPRLIFISFDYMDMLRHAPTN